MRRTSAAGQALTFTVTNWRGPLKNAHRISGSASRQFFGHSFARHHLALDFLDVGERAKPTAIQVDFADAELAIVAQ